MADPRDRWKPTGGIYETWMPGEDREDLPMITAQVGHRNGMPEHKPYEWNRGERARRAEVAARLASIRAGIQARIALEMTEPGDDW